MDDFKHKKKKKVLCDPKSLYSLSFLIGIRPKAGCKVSMDSVVRSIIYHAAEEINSNWNFKHQGAFDVAMRDQKQLTFMNFRSCKLTSFMAMKDVQIKNNTRHVQTSKDFFDTVTSIAVVFKAVLYRLLFKAEIYLQACNCDVKNNAENAAYFYDCINNFNFENIWNAALELHVNAVDADVVQSLVKSNRLVLQNKKYRSAGRLPLEQVEFEAKVKECDIEIVYSIPAPSMNDTGESIYNFLSSNVFNQLPFTHNSAPISQVIPDKNEVRKFSLYLL